MTSNSLKELQTQAVQMLNIPGIMRSKRKALTVIFISFGCTLLLHSYSSSAVWAHREPVVAEQEDNQVNQHLDTFKEEIRYNITEKRVVTRKSAVNFVVNESKHYNKDTASVLQPVKYAYTYTTLRPRQPDAFPVKETVKNKDVPFSSSDHLNSFSIDSLDDNSEYLKLLESLAKSSTGNVEQVLEKHVKISNRSEGNEDVDGVGIFGTVWTYECQKEVGGCVRKLRQRNEVPVDQEVCWLSCGNYGGLWPFPSKKVGLGRCTVPFQKEAVIFKGNLESEDAKALLAQMQEVFVSKLGMTVPEEYRKMFEMKGSISSISEVKTQVSVNIQVESSELRLGLDTDESYSLTVASSEEKCKQGDVTEISVQITAITVYGARHALETLSQLIAYDKYKNSLQILGKAEIKDAPSNAYRGLLLDTARNFIPIPDLKRLIDGMSYNKLNIFHWHLTDSNSFPFYSKRVPFMTLYGAYNDKKIYYPEDIKSLIEYARIRGVKIVPELDAPAHAGNGWQWGESEGLGQLALCVNAEPWRLYCGQPPCGQLNPFNINTLVILEKIYKDMLELFDNDMFHMGGDEVYHACWLTSAEISSWMSSAGGGNDNDAELNFLQVWAQFQNEAFLRLSNATKDGTPIRPIVWTSKMTQSVDVKKFLNPKNYIIQVWESSDSPLIDFLLQEGYQIFISTVDSMYLDHGAGTWLGMEHVWQFRHWQEVYDNNLSKYSRRIQNFKREKLKPLHERQILGGEIALWTEKVNADTMDFRLWPRGSAHGENLWSSTAATFRSPSVYSRLNHHNNRMIRWGIGASQPQPESCYILSGHCDDPNSRI